MFIVKWASYSIADIIKVRRFHNGILPFMALTLFAISCQNTSQPPKEIEIVREPEDLNKKTNENISDLISYFQSHEGKISDSIALRMPSSVGLWYDQQDSLRTWSSQKEWLPLADSLFLFVRQGENFGLFPADYHYEQLAGIQNRLKKDSAAMMDVALWARADILLTDAFMQIVKDIKWGRLPKDSVTLRRDTVLTDSFFVAALAGVRENGTLTGYLNSLEPVHSGYRAIREALSNFVDSMDRRVYTYLSYPFTDPVDSVQYINNLRKRLFEADYLSTADEGIPADTLKAAIKAYQKDKGLTVDGVAGPMVVKSLNNTDQERFKRIAINMDRYKQLPDSMPERYLWVNIPAFELQLWDTDTLRLTSKIIVGRAQTRTPLLNSVLTNFITLPQWTVPYSIIYKEMLPKIRANVDYLQKENLMVVDKNDSIIDPHEINWFKLNKNNFPYLLKQREGDDNSLGVIKFNFRNKYSVYLHDTNARGLFSRQDRALSHGCVRVQQWKKLSQYLIKNDTVRYKADTIAAWIKRKEKHVVNFSLKLPIFIRYVTCDVRNGRIILFDDIYGEDKIARETWFRDKLNLPVL